MKKITNIILLANLSLLADMTQLQNLYDAGSYEEVISHAKSLTREYSNPQLHRLWAKSAQALGKKDEAMSAYERVAILDESDSESRVALVKVYRETDRESLAKEISQELTNYQLTPEQRRALKMLRSTTTSSVKAKAALSMGYDSNINVNPGSAALDDYYGTTGSEGEISTMFGRFTGGVSYVNELDEKGGWYAGADLKAYYQNNLDADYYNLFLGSVELGVGYAGSAYTLYLPVDYDRINYLDKSLLSQYRFDPRVNISVSNDLILNINARYSKRDYIESVDEARNDTAMGAGFGFYYLFDKNFIFCNVKYESYEADEESVVKYVNKDMLTASIGINYNIASWLVSRLDFRFRTGSYDDDISSATQTSTAQRSDEYSQVELKFSHYFMDNFEVYISDRYATNSSNYVPAEYSKNIVMLGLGMNY